MAKHHVGVIMTKLFFILCLLPSCNQLVGFGGFEVGQASSSANPSVGHEPGSFTLGYCPSLSLSSLLCVMAEALVWQGTL